ncbi:hypothetical protein BD414DRAFT_579005 [Trametes punicea]|nr:hypothetical protein BD414DRAFT_579005 [Trametes punicea]
MMIGQKIIESYAELEERETTCLHAESSTGLSIRRIKSAGLRIVTEGETASLGASQEKLNTLHAPEYPSSYLSVRTPDTSHTFGLPNPTMVSFEPSDTKPSASTSSTSSPEVLTARRLLRYSRAERALRAVLDMSSAEGSPEELQIRILEKATAMLNEQARDAQACAERLRELLATKELSSDELRTLQRQRWLEEHNSRARKDEFFLARALLTRLSSSFTDSAPTPLQSSSPAVMTRREANLALFLQHSPTRIAFSKSMARSPLPLLSTANTYRRKTISQVRPLRLRTSAMELALRSPIRVHSRSRSLDGGWHSRSNSNTTDATIVSEGSSGQTAVAQPSIPDVKPSTSPSPVFGESEGTAIIEKLAMMRPLDELVAAVGDVALPDYAVELLEELISPSLKISLNDVSTQESSPAFKTSSESSPVFAAFPSVRAEPDTALPVPRLPSQFDNSSCSSSRCPSSLPDAVTAPRRRAALLSLPQSLHVPKPKFSSIRLNSSNSLRPVPEDRHRTQSSLDGRYIHDYGSSSAMSQSARGERRTKGQEERTNHGVEHRRFSVLSFRRDHPEGGQRGRDGGILARFNRRFSSLRQ